MTTSPPEARHTASDANPPGIIRGTIPVAPTIFQENEELDLAGQRRTVDYLVDSGADGICILANYSEQFSLSDTERDRVAEATIEQCDRRVPVMVTTSHFSARIAAARSRHAETLGADLLMLMPPFFGRTMSVSDDAVLQYFRIVTDGLSIPIMLQDAPISSTDLSVELIGKLASEIPQLTYAKIETPRAAHKIASLRRLAGDDLPGLYDGEEGITLIPDLQAGAQGSMCSSAAPDRISEVVKAFLSGDVDGATKQWETLLPLINYENRQCGLSAAKVLLRAGGVIASDRARYPVVETAPETRAELLRLATRNDLLVLRWGR